MIVIEVMLPVAIIVAAGFIAGRRVLDAAGIKALADLAFSLFLPCLLFRSMATATFETTDAKFLAVYFCITLAWLVAVTLASQRLPNVAKSSAVVLGLAATYSNALQLGIPIQKLAFGESGLRLHLTIISLQSLVLLTTATVWIESARVRAARAAGESTSSLSRTIVDVVRSAILHPVILPIVLGLAWNATDAPLPRWSEQPLAFLASAAGPLLLVLLGAQLSRMRWQGQLRAALILLLLKNVAHPLLVWAAAWAIGLPPLATAVAVVCAALPMGVNVFLFSQRYHAHEDMITAAIALSTLAGILSVTLALALLSRV